MCCPVFAGRELACYSQAHSQILIDIFLRDISLATAPHFTITPTPAARQQDTAERFVASSQHYNMRF